ncbi:ead/Ea22-like family protein [Klebsiella michiganensis]|uniref:ead/Ea22-like family protein n=1 Tax=Klebsiella michiganensis TaxID=1134687 RepID=UPI002E7AFF4D|nr:ead/Ea22-like family protein [Klebsiella michiganensis]MEE1964691.1 ead/Ea22-like family protein [Klebsiella michiganensis]
MTTDITELAQSLKAAAEKATQGNWRAFKYHDGRCGIGGGHHDEIMVCEHISKRRPHDAEFIAMANPANILALVEALEKAQQEAEELSKFKEVMTSAAEALKAGEPLNLESLFKGELASAMFAMMFAGEFVRSGATNYLELLYDVPEFGEMTVTLQKVEGKTPGQRIAELESRTVKLPKPHAHLIWIQAGHAPDDYWDVVAVSHSEKDRCCDGSERYPVYARWEIEEALTAAGIKVEAE